MSSSQNAETWVEKGAQAFANMRMDEAEQDFERAIAADPDSAKAHLCLGVIKFFKYQNGISLQPEFPQEYVEALKNWEPGSPPPPPPYISPLDAATKAARIAEQNSTNGARAEEHLTRALELEPQSEQAKEYLAALYLRWLDPTTQAPSRQHEARRRYQHIVQVNPTHGFANYMLGVIDYEEASTIIRSSTDFPRPIAEEDCRQSLRTQAGPLLAESARNFLRSLEIDPNSSDAMTYVVFVKRDQAYIAETNEEAMTWRAEADALQEKVIKIMEANAEASGQPWPPGEEATITFSRMPQVSGEGEPPVPSFPPDARLMTAFAPPPPLL